MRGKLHFNSIPPGCGCLVFSFVAPNRCFVLLHLLLSIITFTSLLLHSLILLDCYNIYCVPFLLCFCLLLLTPTSWHLSLLTSLYSRASECVLTCSFPAVRSPCTAVCFQRSCSAYVLPTLAFVSCVILYFASYFVHCSLLCWFSPVYYVVLLFVFLVSFLS
jgi:hypothetical protein